MIAILCAVSLALSAAPTPAPPTLLSPLFYNTCSRPCQWVGYSFSDNPAEMALMRADGANATGAGSMWNPTRDPAAPYGCGFNTNFLDDINQLGQSFTALHSFTGVAFATPTFNSASGGCTLSIYSGSPDRWGPRPPRPLASAVLTGLKDNQWSWLTFPQLPPGNYYLEQSAPTGTAIGVWAVGRDSYPGGSAYLNRKPIAGDDLEMMIRTTSDQPLVAPAPASHHSLRLGLGTFGTLAAAHMHFDYDVGNWNNGGFPYYPEWFIKKFPDFGMQDSAGRPILAGMFGHQFPWPSIDMPVIVNGTERYLRAVVALGRDNPFLTFWCMGGESLYPTYGGGVWTDYAPDAVAHYRAWLTVKYRSIAALNAAWHTKYASFDEIKPPAPPRRDLPSMDWLDYRNVAMAERFVYHFSAIKSVDPVHLAATCNHGDLFRARYGPELGEDMNLYAGSSDGWEMGQIMSDADPDLYNLMWMHAAGTFGKPLNPVRLAYKKTDPKAEGGGTSFTPAAVDRYFYECVGTGAWHMGFCQWRGDLPDGEWGLKGRPGEAEVRRVLTQWHKIEHYFDDAWPIKEKVGIYFAQPTWTMDGFPALWTDLCRDLTQRQIGFRVLCDTQILDGELNDCSVVLSADNTIMSSACRQALISYATQGKGHLVLIGRNAVDDENMNPAQGDPFASVRSKATTFAADAPDLAGKLQTLLDARKAPYITVSATSSKPYLQPWSETPVVGHDIPHDLAGHKSLGQTFVTTIDGLRGVSVSNPTFNKKYAGAPFTIEVLAGGPGGKVVGRKTFPASEMGDNARHEVPIDPPAPAGKYYVRLLTPPNLPPLTLGVWGRAADTYPAGSRYVDDKPASGDLEIWLSYLRPMPARAALESFTLSDGLNAIVILTNIGGVEVRANLSVAPDLLPGDVTRVHLTDLATGADLGSMSRDDLHARVAVPAHRSALVFIADDVSRATAAAAVAKLAASPAGAKSPHLARARDALAAGRYAKALACVRRAEATIPCQLTAKVADGSLHLAVTAPADAPNRLKVRFIPLPGKLVHLNRAGAAGEFAATIPLARLGVRYDYAAKRYVPYHGALEIDVTGATPAGHTLAASTVVTIPPG